MRYDPDFRENPIFRMDPRFRKASGSRGSPRFKGEIGCFRIFDLQYLSLKRGDRK